eukprot:GHUV01036505.1.p1 GENE.GHUV01036505.1~~GHUV01036505.1.p1  ORF type:complete len:138 (-),score=16.95 GHUV01036505.1:314-727(-)
MPICCSCCSCDIKLDCGSRGDDLNYCCITKRDRRILRSEKKRMGGRGSSCNCPGLGRLQQLRCVQRVLPKEPGWKRSNIISKEVTCASWGLDVLADTSATHITQVPGSFSVLATPYLHADAQHLMFQEPSNSINGLQ